MNEAHHIYWHDWHSWSHTIGLTSIILLYVINTMHIVLSVYFLSICSEFLEFLHVLNDFLFSLDIWKISWLNILRSHILFLSFLNMLLCHYFSPESPALLSHYILLFENTEKFFNIKVQRFYEGMPQIWSFYGNFPRYPMSPFNV